jgi:uncharacterized protein YjbJ (UPF0337 family)
VICSSTQRSPSSPNSQANSSSQEAIGNLSGAAAWKSSGEQDKSQAVDAMKQAGAARDASTQGKGVVEEKLGNLVGCEGMQNEGALSKDPRDGPNSEGARTKRELGEDAV